MTYLKFGCSSEHIQFKFEGCKALAVLGLHIHFTCWRSKASSRMSISDSQDIVGQKVALTPKAIFPAMSCASDGHRVCTLPN